MVIYPAIDVSGGRVVRLTRGDYDEMTVYGGSPQTVALEYKEKGAEYLHTVDLDGAKDGTLINFEPISKAASAAGLFTQVGGGIRDLDRVERYLSAGLQRVIIGTAAVSDPEFLKTALRKYGEKIAVGVDAKSGKVAVGGWLETTDIDSIDFCKKLLDLGLRTIIYTDISKDGMLEGPNHEVYEELSQLKGLNIIASGGVSSLSDVERLSKTGIHGAIIGKALYGGAIDLAEAIEAGKKGGTTSD